MNVHDELKKVLKHIFPLESYIDALLLSDKGIVSYRSRNTYSWFSSFEACFRDLNNTIKSLLNAFQFGGPNLFISECPEGKVGIIYSKKRFMCLVAFASKDLHTGMLIYHLENAMNMVNNILDSYSYFSP